MSSKIRPQSGILGNIITHGKKAVHKQPQPPKSHVAVPDEEVEKINMLNLNKKDMLIKPKVQSHIRNFNFQHQFQQHE